MTNPIRVALVGYGLAGKVFHAPLIAATQGLALHSIVSSDAQKVRADFPATPVITDFESVLHDPRVELVVLATPDHLHAPQAIAALRAGKHVVIDKPFTLNAEEASQVADCAMTQNLLLSVFQNRRWDADYLTLQHLMTEGKLGEIVQFESHFDRLRPVSVDRWKDNRAVGLWQDLGPHLVDQALNLFGMPHAVYADIAVQREGGSAPDYAHVILRYERLRVLLHMSQSTHASGLRFAVHGTQGSYIKQGLDPQEDQSKAGMKPHDPLWGIDAQPGTLTQDEVETRVESQRGDYPAYYALVRDALLGIAPNPVTPQCALGVMQVLDAGKLSAESQREVRV